MAWLEPWVDRLPRGDLLDLATGEGLKALWWAWRGFAVTGVDFSGAALRLAERSARQLALEANWKLVDLDRELPESIERYAVVSCFNFFSPELLRQLGRARSPGSALVFETFAPCHLELDASVGPKSRRFLVGVDRLATLLPDEEILHSFEGVLEASDTGFTEPVGRVRWISRRAPASSDSALDAEARGSESHEDR